MADEHIIRTESQLSALLGELTEASIKKEIPFVHAHYRAMIEASPFVLVATRGPGGLDVSPRGDPAGFVVVDNDRTLLMPERRGNNRADTLRNLLHDPHVALLFMIPGIGETLRVNGRAAISVEPALLQRFVVDGKPPRCVLVVDVDTVFFQCARAIMRSKLWQPANLDIRAKVPTPGAILTSLTEGAFDGEKYDRELPGRQKATLY